MSEKVIREQGENEGKEHKMSVKLTELKGKEAAGKIDEKNSMIRDKYPSIFFRLS